jgi:hypothetical protein
MIICNFLVEKPDQVFKTLADVSILLDSEENLFTKRPRKLLVRVWPIATMELMLVIIGRIFVRNSNTSAALQRLKWRFTLANREFF